MLAEFRLIADVRAPGADKLTQGAEHDRAGGLVLHVRLLPRRTCYFFWCSSAQPFRVPCPLRGGLFSDDAGSDTVDRRVKIGLGLVDALVPVACKRFPTDAGNYHQGGPHLGDGLRSM
jgi:hypothetical protein